MKERLALGMVVAMGLFAAACIERGARAEAKPAVLLYEAPVIAITAPKGSQPGARLAVRPAEPPSGQAKAGVSGAPAVAGGS